MGVAERRERERERRRQQIIDAAERVFFEKSPLEATMEDVATEAELSKGTLYLYFASKDALYLAIATRAMHHMHGEVSQLASKELSGFETLERICAVHQEHVRQRPDHMKTMLAWQASGFHADAEMPGFAEHRDLSARMFRTTVAVIERGQQDGSVRDDIDPFQCALHIWGAHMGVTMLYFNRDEVARRAPVELQLEGLLPSFSKLLLSSLRPVCLEISESGGSQ